MQQIIAIETGATDILSGSTGSASASMDAKGQSGEFSSLLSGQKEAQAKSAIAKSEAKNSANDSVDKAASQSTKEQAATEIDASKAKSLSTTTDAKKETKQELHAEVNDTSDDETQSVKQVERLNLEDASFDFFDLITASNDAELAVRTEGELSDADTLALNEIALQKLVSDNGGDLGAAVKGSAKNELNLGVAITPSNNIAADTKASEAAVNIALDSASPVEETDMLLSTKVATSNAKIDNNAIESAVKDVKFALNTDVVIEDSASEGVESLETTVTSLKNNSQQQVQTELAAKPVADMVKSKVAEQVQANIASADTVNSEQVKMPMSGDTEILQTPNLGDTDASDGKAVSAELAKQIEMLKSVSEGKVVIASETPPTKMPAAEQLKTIPTEKVAPLANQTAASANVAASTNSVAPAMTEQFAEVIDAAEVAAIAEEPSLKPDMTLASNKQTNGNASPSLPTSANMKQVDVQDELQDDVVELDSVEELTPAKSAEVTNIRAPAVSSDVAVKAAVVPSKEDLAQTSSASSANKEGTSEQDMQQGQQSKEKSEWLADIKQIKANTVAIPDNAEFRPFGDAKIAAAMSERAADSQIQQASDSETKFKSQLAQLSKDAIDLTKNDFAAKMRDRMLLMAASKVQSLEIKLDPAELGSINVRVQMQGDQATVTFAVQQAQTKDALESAMPKLKDMMEQQGLQLSDSHVEQQSQQEFAESGQNSNSESSDENGDEIEQATEIDTRTANLPPGRVDFYA